MPLKKIADLPDESVCHHPDHAPPTMIVLPPGIYEHTCPACGTVTRFVVRSLHFVRDMGTCTTSHRWDNIGVLREEGVR